MKRRGKHCDENEGYAWHDVDSPGDEEGQIQREPRRSVVIHKRRVLRAEEHGGVLGGGLKGLIHGDLVGVFPAPGLGRGQEAAA